MRMRIPFEKVKGAIQEGGWDGGSRTYLFDSLRLGSVVGGGRVGFVRAHAVLGVLVVFFNLV